MQKQKDHIHNGQEYRPFEFPIYRSMDDRNVYKMISGSVFLNVIDNEKATLIAVSDQMAPASFPGFISNTKEITADKFSQVYFDALEKINSKL